MNLKYILIAPFLLTGCLMTRSEIADTTDRRENQTQITSMQQQKASEEVRFQDYDASLRQINGRLEALEHRMNLNLESKQQEKSIDTQTQKQLIDQMKVFEETIAKLEARLAEMESNAPSIPTVSGKTPTGKANETSYYMEAEQLFAQKEWRRAILSYQKYRDENPKGKKFADATYKIGNCFQELGKKSEAKSFYDEVVEKFPKSDSARKATFRLKNLK